MPKDVFSFSFEGIEAFTKRLDEISNQIDQRIEETLMELAEKVIHDAKRLAPLDSGDLEASLHVGDVKKEIGRIYVEFGNSPETDDYAVPQHEGFRKTKSGQVITFSPGEKTLSEPAYMGYQPGKKYLENALKINEKLIIKELRKVMEGG